MADASSAGGVVAWKFGAGIFGVGVLAAVAGFLVLWPKSWKEALARAVATLIGSATLGPLVVILAYWKYPDVFASATRLLLHAGVPEEMAQLMGLFMVGTPLLAMAGLPFWWILGGILAWFQKRQGQDIVQMAVDAKADAAKVLP